MPSDPNDPDGVDYEFIEGLERITGKVGRAIAVGFPSLFLVGLLILPLGLPSAIALLIVILGATGIVVAYEVLRAKEKREPRGRRGLSGTARLMIVGVLAFIVLYLLIFSLTGQSQT